MLWLVNLTYEFYCMELEFLSVTKMFHDLIITKFSQILKV